MLLPVGPHLQARPEKGKPPEMGDCPQYQLVLKT